LRQQRRILQATLVAGLAGCAAQPARNADISVAEADSAGIRIVTISGPVETLPEWGIHNPPATFVDGNAPPFLGEVGDVALLEDGRVLLYDLQAHEVRMFGPDGREIRLLAAAGDGPGEVRAVTALSATMGDSVFVFDVRHGELSVFDVTGALARSISVPAEFAGPNTYLRSARALGSDRLLLYGFAIGVQAPPDDPPIRFPRDAIVQIRSANGHEALASTRFPGGYSLRAALGEVGSPLANRPFISASDGTVVHGSGQRYELTFSGYDLKPFMVVRWPDLEVTASDDILRDLRAPMETELADLREAAPDIANNLLEALFDASVVPDSLPAVASAVLDNRGRIWVSRFRPATMLPAARTGEYAQWHQEDLWHVLGSNGYPLARLRLPPNTRLVTVRDNHAVVVSRDALGVESVGVFDIDTGSGAR